MCHGQVSWYSLPSVSTSPPAAILTLHILFPFFFRLQIDLFLFIELIVLFGISLARVCDCWPFFLDSDLATDRSYLRTVEHKCIAASLFRHFSVNNCALALHRRILLFLPTPDPRLHRRCCLSELHFSDDHCATLCRRIARTSIARASACSVAPFLNPASSSLNSYRRSGASSDLRLREKARAVAVISRRLPAARSSQSVAGARKELHVALSLCPSTRDFRRSHLGAALEG